MTEEEARKGALFLERTVRDNPWIPSEPTARQVLFLASREREVLFGGAAGGGKSEAILMAAAQFVEEPTYRALILRRTFADLALPGALMDRAQEWWGGKKVKGQEAKWDGQRHAWTFPSGAKVVFGYMEHENDKYRYQGSEFHTVAVDELTQFRDHMYRYLFSRQRRKADSWIPIRMRCGTNPGGIGMDWVKKRFVTGSAPGRRFIPAKIDDNPYLDREAYQESLAELDPATREQLEKGSWDDITGGRFKDAWFRYYTRSHGYYVFGDRQYPGELVKDRFLTVDPACTVAEVAKPDPDYTAIGAWGFTPCGKLVWLGCLVARVEIPEIALLVAWMQLLHRTGKVYMEGGGNQKGAIQVAQRFQIGVGGQAWHEALLRQHFGRHYTALKDLESRHKGQHLNIVPWSHENKDKLSNATAFLNAAEAGRVWLPSDDPDFPLDDVKAQLLRWTGDPKQSGHDDIITAASIAGQQLEVVHPVKKSAPPRVLTGALVNGYGR